MNDVLSGQKKFSHTTAMYMRLQVKNGQRAYAYREVFVCVCGFVKRFCSARKARINYPFHIILLFMRVRARRQRHKRSVCVHARHLMRAR